MFIRAGGKGKLGDVMALDSANWERYKVKLTKAMLNRVSCMSDSKWEKLFQAVEKSDITRLDIGGATIKFLVDGVKPFHFQNYCGDYLEGSYGVAQYKEIEWILIPAAYEIERRNRDERLQPMRINNDIHALKELIDSLGLYEYDFNEDGLKIYGYK